MIALELYMESISTISITLCWSSIADTIYDNSSLLVVSINITSKMLSNPYMCRYYSGLSLGGYGTVVDGVWSEEFVEEELGSGFDVLVERVSENIDDITLLDKPPSAGEFSTSISRFSELEIRKTD